MTREEAQLLAQAFLAANGNPNSVGLNPQGFGGVALGGAQLSSSGTTRSRRWSAAPSSTGSGTPPKPGILEGFQAEEKKGTDTGGGTVDFETGEQVPVPQPHLHHGASADPHFIDDMKRLMKASLVWSGDGAEPGGRRASSELILTSQCGNVRSTATFSDPGTIILPHQQYTPFKSSWSPQMNPIGTLHQQGPYRCREGH